MQVDDSFTKPGSIPFKWEIRPGVPKIQTQQKQYRKQLSPPSLPSPSPPFTPRRSPFPSPPPHRKLKPPPAGFIYLPLPEPRTRSFRSAPRTRSETWRSENQPTRLRPECVSPGCFPSPLLKRRDSKRRTNPIPDSVSDYLSDLETQPRWSFSSRKSISPFRESSSTSSSFSSYQSSPRVAREAEWAGFALF
ncbi:hydroxyproline-rich glycoprotein family protein [Euphorbia peplus]|nr:hydroxyproline-rich glycoprotein family protein [Euphorbia peplus]